MQTKSIKSILIANRGEIAGRIIRTAHALNINTVAIYCDLDKDALFVREADIAVNLNGILPEDTYLNIDKIIDIAKQYNVDAIHPGYGFLSENIDFVKRLEKESIRFLGPSSRSMEMLSDKLKSKNIANELKIPTLLSCPSLINNVDQAKIEAKKIGYPVILKAISGGGGKGIRIVWNDSEMEEKLNTTKYEAKTLYKNEDIIIEKYIESPRHIEIQILADKFNNVVCLGERECSIQRFNQKIIEESPSVFIDEKIRKKMYECAVKLVKHCKYYSAGTLEFLIDKNKNFYFLEMNTRIQVEHPVSEYITGIDIVKEMINIEENKALSFKQSDIKLKGHALECRICAENPAKNFIPSTGKILHYIEPITGDNVRLDNGVELGTEISPYYDSMMAKLITYGNTRNEAIETMKTALSEYEIGGFETNINFLESIIRQETFINGNISTSFIKNNYPNGFNFLPLTDNIKKAFVATALVLYIKDLQYEFATHQNCYIPRKTELTKLYVCINDQNYLVTIIEYNENFLKISYNAEIIQLKFDYQRGDFTFKSSINGLNNFIIRIKKNTVGYNLKCSGLDANVKIYNQEEFELLKYMPKIIEKSKPQFLLSPITGKIIKLKIEENQEVQAGMHLLSIESMKIDNTILCDYNCKIKKVFHKIGDNVVADEKIIEFEYEN